MTSEAVCIINNCGKRCPAGEPFCADHRDKRPPAVRSAGDICASEASQSALSEHEENQSLAAPTTPVPEAEGGGEREGRVAAALKAATHRNQLSDSYALALARAAISALSSEALPVVCGGEDGSVRADIAEPGSPARAAVVPAAEQAGGGRYRKRPVVIEAWQFQGCDQWVDVPEWIADAERLYGRLVAGEVGRVADLENEAGFLEIHTLEGVHRAQPGDWIIKGVMGELYPCKPDIFAQTYETATPPPDHDAIPSAEGGSGKDTRELREPLAQLIERYTRRGRNGAYVTDITTLADQILSLLKSPRGEA